MAIHNLTFNTQLNTLKMQKFKTDRSIYMNIKSLNIYIFKCLNLNTNILQKHSDIHNYPTTNNNKFIAPKCIMRKSEMSINFKSIKV